MSSLNQPDLFVSHALTASSPPIVLELRGLGPIPSFKNRKLIRAWIDKTTRKIRSLLYLEPELQQWMTQATSLLESQLSSALQTSGVETRTGALAPSQIATLLPLDDCWTSFRRVVIESELCEPGQEGATIIIERL